MSAFEFAFTLFGLVLGLAMAEVLLGFVGVLKARTTSADRTAVIRIGWLTPMLAFVVCLDLITSWDLAWHTLENVPVTVASLASGLLETALYFIAASLIWPDDPRDWPNLDDWFDDHRAQVGLALGLANVGFSFISVMEVGLAAFWTFEGFLQLVYVLSCFGLAAARTRTQAKIPLVILAIMLCEIVGESAVGMLRSAPAL